MLRQKARLFLKKAVMSQKKRSRSLAFAWGKVDSNHRTDTRTDLQSVAIATMRLPQEMNEPFVCFDAAKLHLFSLATAKTAKFFATLPL